jgi:hypothetical protein
LPTRVAVVATGAWIRRRDQGEARGEFDRAHRPRHDDAAVLQGLAKALDGVAPELVEFVEEEYAVVSERA